ncbi:MAG: methionine--tRNA ligase [Parcubacteria group bacterium]|nr:methionine--tRNA ligase [Parcubacteria group bacterium]
MVKRRRIFLTTSIPYVNAAPHVGHALEFVQTDARARFERLRGNEVFFLTGTDENSLKNVQAAEKAGVQTRDLVDRYTREFSRLGEALAMQIDGFIRTTEGRHIAGAQKLWASCDPEDIYTKQYRGLYCVGCEAFYAEKELVDGRCPEHQTELQVVEEENYFFRLSRYQKQLTTLIQSDQLLITPETRKNEVLEFIRAGLEDFSISRSRSRAKDWGVPVPRDEKQIMYVWFDALASYITGVGYGSDEAQFHTWWNESDEIIHVIGKGILRFHAVYWPAMLLSAGLRLPTTLFVHGYITIAGDKISKTLGNVIDPFEIVNRRGADAFRYYLLHDISPDKDTDFTLEQFEAKYRGDLVHGIGNYVSRVLAMIEQFFDGRVPHPRDRAKAPLTWKGFIESYISDIQAFRFDGAFLHATHLIRLEGDGVIAAQKPWELAKAGKKEELADVLYHQAELLRQCAWLLEPFLPSTARSIRERLQEADTSNFRGRIDTWGLLEPGTPVTKGEPLFPL